MSTLDSAILDCVKEDGLLSEGHFAYPSGRHSAAHLDYDRLVTNPAAASRMGYALAKMYFTAKIDTVAAPSVWGAGLAQWVAYFLEPRARVVYATPQPDGSREIAARLHPLISGRRLLLIDNVTLSGNTIEQFASSLTDLGGEIIGIACLWAGSNQTIGRHDVVGLLNSHYPSWDQDECPICAAGVKDLEQVTL